MKTILPVIALVQSTSVDADLIEASLRNAGMRNSFLRYDSADALIAMLSEDAPRDVPPIAVAIVESNAWRRLSIWRNARPANPLPVIVTFEDDRDLQEFARARALQAAGTLKPFTPKTLIRMLEPLRCRWLLMDCDGTEEGA